MKYLLTLIITISLTHANAQISMCSFIKIDTPSLPLEGRACFAAFPVGTYWSHWWFPWPIKTQWYYHRTGRYWRKLNKHLKRSHEK